MRRSIVYAAPLRQVHVPKWAGQLLPSTSVTCGARPPGLDSRNLREFMTLAAMIAVIAAFGILYRMVANEERHLQEVVKPFKR